MSVNRMYTGRQLDDQAASIARHQLMPTIMAHVQMRDRIARLEWRRVFSYRVKLVGAVTLAAVATVVFCFLLVEAMQWLGVCGAQIGG